MEYYSWYYAMKEKFKQEGFSRPIPAGDYHFGQVCYAYYQAENDNRNDLALCTYLADKNIWMYYWGDQPFPGRMPEPGARVVLPETAAAANEHAAKDNENGQKQGYSSPGTRQLHAEQDRRMSDVQQQRSRSGNFACGVSIKKGESPVIAQPTPQVAPFPQLAQTLPAPAIPQGYCLVQAHLRRLPNNVPPLGAPQAAQPLALPASAAPVSVSPAPPIDLRRANNAQPRAKYKPPRSSREYIVIDDEPEEDKSKVTSSKKKKSQRAIDSTPNATPTKANRHNLPPRPAQLQPQLNDMVRNMKIDPNISNAPRGPLAERRYEGMPAQAKSRRIEVETRLKGSMLMFGWNLQLGEPWMAVRFQANNLKVAYSKEALAKLNNSLAKQNLILRCLNFGRHVLVWPEFTRKECLCNPQDLERLSELRGMLEEESEIRGTAKTIDDVWDNYKFRAPLSKRKPALPRGLKA